MRSHAAPLLLALLVAVPPARSTCGRAVDVSASSELALFLKDDGTVWALGSPSAGAGPYGDAGASAVLVPLPIAARAVSAGEGISAALGIDGSLWTWSGSGVARPWPALPASTHLGTWDTAAFVVDAAGGARVVSTDGSALAAGTFAAATLPLVAFAVQAAEIVALDSAGVAWRIPRRSGCDGGGVPVAPGPAAPVAGLPPLVGIAAADFATLALAADGSTFLWGCFAPGLALDPLLTSSALPVPSASVPGAATVALVGGGWRGAGNAFALDPASGITSAWGLGGLTGDGSGRSMPASAPTRTSVTNAVAISGAGGRGVAVDAAGGTWTWGWRSVDAPQLDRMPAEVPSLRDVVDVAAGWDHLMALTADGRAWSWGCCEGRLGLGPGMEIAPVPRELPGSNWTQVEAGGWVSVLRRADGTAWTCGWGMDGTREGDQTVPVQAAGLSSVVSVAAGGYHALALLADGTVWGWGDNSQGQLGSSSAVPYVATPVQAPGLTGVVAISAWEDSSFALRNDGTVWAWGQNDGMRFGVDDVWFYESPTLVQFGPFVEHSQGGFHSLAKDAAGATWSWGWSREGALGCGDGLACALAQPVRLPAPVAPDRLDAGFNNSYAIYADGSAWAWGWNEYGFAAPELPDDRIYAPRLMTTLPPVAQIASGMMATIARTLDGRVFTWGEGYQLGRGPWADAMLPRPLDLGDALDGLGDTLRLRDEPAGTVLTWGSRWGTSLHRVYRSTVPSRADEALVSETPGLTWTDPEPAAPAFFYRVAGVDCAGVEGP